MNWIREIIYFNDKTDFIFLSKWYKNICLYKFLEKIVQKMYLIYQYSDQYPWKIFKYYFNLRLNEYAHIRTTNIKFC